MENPPLTKVQELADLYWVAGTLNQILRVLFGKVVLGKIWEFW
jgi:hypothetical protein